MSAAARGRRPRKGLVEEAWVLRIRDVLRAIDAKPAGCPAGLTLHRPDGSGEPLDVVVRYRNEAPTSVEIAYNLAAESFHYRLDLVGVPQHFGGERWSVYCPLRTATDQRRVADDAASSQRRPP